MVTIGFVLLGAGILAGVLVTVLLAVADPVLLSRVNGEPAQGASGRHIEQDRVSQDRIDGARVVPLRRRETGLTEHTAA
jgi:hypothetical protein